jgi:hypothetical protein
MNGRLLLLTLILATALPSAGFAGDPIAEADRHVEALRGTNLPADTALVKQALREMLDHVQALQETVEGIEDPGLQRRGRIRLGAGMAEMARALMGTPCPPELDPEQCSIFTGLLREQSAPVLQQAKAQLEPIAPEDLEPHDRRMQRRALRLIDVLGGGAETPEERQDPADPPPPPDWAPDAQSRPAREGEHALVWADAWFSTHLGEGGQRVRTRSWEEGRSGHLGEVWTVRVAGRQGDRIEVELGAIDYESHCRAAAPLSPAFEVRLLVAEDDLAPVLTTSFERTWPDGTAVALRRGVPVGEGMVRFDDLLLPLPGLDEAVAGTTYRPPTPRPAQGGGGWLTSDAVLTLGDRPVAFTGRRSVKASIWATTRDGVHLATLVEACGSVTVRSDQAPHDSADGVLSRLDQSRAKHLVRAGTPLYWPDRSPAGRLARDHVFYGDALGGGELRCAELAFGDQQAEASLRVCVDAGDVFPVN